MNLIALGWDEFQKKSEAEIPHELLLGRIAVEYPAKYLLFTEEGEYEAVIRPKWLKTGGDVPKVGDWVACSRLQGERKVIVEKIFPRTSKISRRATGNRTKREANKIREQIIATNVDVVFVVQGMDGDYNLNRLERYVAMVLGSGARPVLILNKDDVTSESLRIKAEVTEHFPEIPVHVISAKKGTGLSALEDHIAPGVTVAFVGSSGVGKSTLINRLVGKDTLATQEVREKDSRGRHTTTWKEMVLLPQGGVLIDTPGMRELEPWTEEDADLNPRESHLDRIKANEKIAADRRKIVDADDES
jgi:ribosome biogenesis GTPase / thiamine phosphate phosphatase